MWLRTAVVPRDYPGPVASDFPELLARVRSTVKPVRDKSKRKLYREQWWRFAERCPGLYSAVSPLARVLVAPQVSKYLAVAFVPKGIVYSMMVVVFALEESWSFALLQSSVHESWVRSYASTLETRLRYTPTDVFETFPFPAASETMTAAADDYLNLRSESMRSRNLGMTSLYNEFHDPSDTSPTTRQLRERHVAMDRAVLAAYGWLDLPLAHGFYSTELGTRFTVSPTARLEILDRLLELNHQRYAEEAAQGLHEKAAAKGKSGSGTKRGNKPKTAPLLEGV